MSIKRKQFEAIMSKIVQATLKKGKALDINMLTIAAKDYPYIPGKPMTSFVEQVYKTKFDISAHNNMIEQLSDDLELLYSEYMDLINKSMANISITETISGLYRHQIKQLQSAISDLLLLSAGTNIGLISSDTFIDLTQVDQANTTASIDLQNDSVVLSMLPDAARVKTSHLAGVVNPGIKFVPDTADVHTLQGGLEDAVVDTVAGWSFTARNPEPVALTASFGIALTPRSAGPVSISRVDIDPLTIGEMYIQIYGSTDGVNYTYFQGNSTPKVLDNKRLSFVFPLRLVKYLKLEFTKDVPDEAIAIDRAQQYLYNFGVKLISMYKMGYTKESVIQTKTLTPRGSTAICPIDKLVLATEEDVPSGTDINYQLSADGGTSWIPITPLNRSQSSAVSLVRLNTVTKSKVNVPVTAALPSIGDINGKSYHTLYEFNAEPVTPSVKLERGLYGWAYEAGRTRTELRRYINYVNWVDQNKQGTLDRVPLYVPEREELFEHAASDGASPTAVTLRYPVLYSKVAVSTDEIGDSLDYPTGSITRVIRHMTSDPEYPISHDNLVNNLAAPDLPGYVIQVSVPGRLDGQPKPPVYITINYFNKLPGANQPFSDITEREVDELKGMKLIYSFKLSGSSEPVTDTTTIVSARFDGNYALILTILDTKDNFKGESKNSSQATVDTTSNDTDWHVPSMSLVDQVYAINNNIIYIATAQQILGGDSIEVEYLRRLMPNEKIVERSISVRLNEARADYGKLWWEIKGGDSIYPEAKQKDGGRKKLLEELQNKWTKDGFKLNVDFKIDAATNSIVRIPTGNIIVDPQDTKSYVVVNYEVETIIDSLSSYSTYVFTEGPDTKTLELTAIAIDSFLGEEATIDSYRLDGSEQITLTPGWHKVKVKSKRLINTDKTINKDSCIYKVINSTSSTIDIGGSLTTRYIFPAYRQADMTGTPAPSVFGNLFTKQKAFIDRETTRVSAEALTQSTYPGKIQEYFAVKKPTEVVTTVTYQVILGWDPYTDPKIMVYPPDVGGASEPSNAEVFAIEFETAMSEDPVTSVLLKATLTREKDPYITPTLHGYSVRFTC